MLEAAWLLEASGDMADLSKQGGSEGVGAIQHRDSRELVRTADDGGEKRYRRSLKTIGCVRRQPVVKNVAIVMYDTQAK